MVESLTKVLLAAVVTLWPSMGLAQTYYLRADGEARAKEAATGCESATTAMGLPWPGGISFSPGDTVVLCHEGGVFRAGLTPNSSGAGGSPITFDGRGTAVISGADLVTGWTPDSGNVYWAAVTNRPQQVFVDGVFANRRASRDEVSGPLDWFWEEGTGRLYLFDDLGNPDERVDPGIEAGQRNNGISIGEKEHIVITGVTVAQANMLGIFTWISNHITIRSCVLEWNWINGAAFNSNVGYSHITVEDSIARYNGCHGISATLGGGTSSDHVFRRNECYENGRYQGEDYEPEHRWTGGIKVFGPGGMSNVLVEQNEVHHNGYDGGSSGNGIWFDFASASGEESANIIRHNLVYENQKNGIFIESSDHCHVIGNVLYGNAKNGEQGLHTNAGIRVDARETSTSDSGRFYNNTIVGGQHGIHVATYNPADGLSVSNNDFRNNIIAQSVSAVLRADTGGDNDGVHGSGNVYENNVLGPEGPDFIYWGGWMSTYAEWEAAYGGSTASIRQDPMFHDAEADRYWLGEGSPAVDAGLDLGGDHAMALHPSSAWPDAVVLADQRTAGSGWEAGAYVFGDACVATTCAAEGAECGSIEDGCGGSLDCGSCTAPETCGGGGTANVCGTGSCVPLTCEEAGATCGQVDDGCGGELDCGPCDGDSGTSSGCGCALTRDGGTGLPGLMLLGLCLIVICLRRRDKGRSRRDRSGFEGGSACS